MIMEETAFNVPDWFRDFCEFINNKTVENAWQDLEDLGDTCGMKEDRDDGKWTNILEVFDWKHEIILTWYTDA